MSAAAKSSNTPPVENPTVGGLDAQALLYLLSHDLRAPARAAAGYGEILVERVAHLNDARVQDVSAKMMRSLERIQNMLDAILSLSRVRTRRDDVSLFEWQPLLKLAQHDLREIIETHEATIESDTPDAAWGDRHQMLTMTKVLLMNAIIHGGPKPHIQIRSETHDDRSRFIICDSGPGLSGTDYERVLKPFGIAGARTPESGVGMGLTLAREILVVHGGRMLLGKHEPTGLVVTCELPWSGPDTSPEGSLDPTC